MYVITVQHQWKCDDCGDFTPNCDTEPELRHLAMKGLGWTEQEWTGGELNGETKLTRNQHLCRKCTMRRPF